MKKWKKGEKGEKGFIYMFLFGGREFTKVKIIQTSQIGNELGSGAELIFNFY